MLLLLCLLQERKQKKEKKTIKNKTEKPHRSTMKESSTTISIGDSRVKPGVSHRDKKLKEKKKLHQRINKKQKQKMANVLLGQPRQRETQKSKSHSDKKTKGSDFTKKGQKVKASKKKHSHKRK